MTPRLGSTVCAGVIALLLGWPRAGRAEPLQNTNALWVADKDRLLKLSPTGSVLLSTVPRNKATTLATDPLSGALWVGHRGGVSKHAFDGTLILSLRLAVPSHEDDKDDDDDSEHILLTIDPSQGRP